MGTWTVVDGNLVPGVVALLPCCRVHYNRDRSELALSALWPAVTENGSVPAGRRSPWSQCEVDFSLCLTLAVAGSEFISGRFSRIPCCLSFPGSLSFLLHILLEVERWPCSHCAGQEALFSTHNLFTFPVN